MCSVSIWKLQAASSRLPAHLRFLHSPYGSQFRSVLFHSLPRCLQLRLLLLLSCLSIQNQHCLLHRHTEADPLFFLRSQMQQFPCHGSYALLRWLLPLCLLLSVPVIHWFLLSLLALHLLNTPCSFPPFLPGTNNGYKHKNPPWNTYLYPGTDIIFAIRGTTRIESQSCIVLSKIPLFMRNVQSTYQPTIIISALQYFSFNRSAPECSLLSSFPKQCSQSVTPHSCQVPESRVSFIALLY